jgi:hypothetical protein
MPETFNFPYNKTIHKFRPKLIVNFIIAMAAFTIGVMSAVTVISIITTT